MKTKIFKLILCLGAGILSLSACGGGHTHEYKKVSALEATCTEEGHQAYYKCLSCDKIFNTDKEETTLAAITIAALGHNYGELHEAVIPTDCAHPGHHAYYQCDRCEAYFDESKNEKEWSDIEITASHDLVHHERVEPTYTAPGNIEYWECSRCGAKFKDAEGKEKTNYVKLDQLTRFASVRIATQEGNSGAYWDYIEDETKVTVVNGKQALVAGAYIELGLKDAVALNYFELSAKFTVNFALTGDNIGIGVRSYISNAMSSYGGIMRPNINFSRVTFGGFQGGVKNFIKTVPGLASNLDDLPAGLKAAFTDNGDGTHSFRIKLVRNEEGLSWYFGNYLIGLETYYTDPTGATKDDCYYYADEKLDAGIVIRNHDASLQEQHIVIEDIELVK